MQNNQPNVEIFSKLIFQRFNRFRRFGYVKSNSGGCQAEIFEKYVNFATQNNTSNPYKSSDKYTSPWARWGYSTPPLPGQSETTFFAP